MRLMLAFNQCARRQVAFNIVGRGLCASAGGLGGVEIALGMRLARV